MRAAAMKTASAGRRLKSTTVLSAKWSKNAKEIEIYYAFVGKLDFPV